MVRDALELACLVVAFAAAVIAHLAIVVGLWSRGPRWRAAVALVAVPLAPYWALRAGMPARAAVWLASGVGYVALRVATG
jgi:hypothetical protein